MPKLVRPQYINPYTSKPIKQQYLYIIFKFNASGEPIKVWEYYLGNDGKAYYTSSQTKKRFLYPNNYYFFISPFQLSVTMQNSLRPEDFEEQTTVTSSFNQTITLPIVVPGDILLRTSSTDAGSVLIKECTGGNWSHAGIIAKDTATNRLVAIDAYPEGYGLGANLAVTKRSIDHFFNFKPGYKALVLRYKKDRQVARDAGEWALKAINYHYYFDLYDEDLNISDNYVYCSEFVYYSYEAQGIKLFNPMNILNPQANKDRTMQAMRKYARASGSAPSIAPDSFIDPKIRKKIGNHNGLFISPGQYETAKDLEKLFDIK